MRPTRGKRASNIHPPVIELNPSEKQVQLPVGKARFGIQELEALIGDLALVGRWFYVAVRDTHQRQQESCGRGGDEEGWVMREFCTGPKSDFASSKLPKACLPNQVTHARTYLVVDLTTDTHGTHLRARMHVAPDTVQSMYLLVSLTSLCHVRNREVQSFNVEHTGVDTSLHDRGNRNTLFNLQLLPR